MAFDWTNLLALLTSPQALALIAPIITEVIDSAVKNIPNPLKPLVAIVIGAIGGALGDSGAAVGAFAGTAGIGVAEVATHAKAKLAQVGADR